MSFFDDLKASQISVAAVASWMAEHDCDVVIKPTLIAPNKTLRHEYVDSGDIEIRQRVEVKHRKISFTSAEDYPYSTIIVDEAYKVDRIPRGQLWGYIIVNQACSHVCCLLADTKAYWLKESKYDNKQGDTRIFYVCPIRFGLFCRLPEVINDAS